MSGNIMNSVFIDGAKSLHVVLLMRRYIIVRACPEQEKYSSQVKMKYNYNLDIF